MKSELEFHLKYDIRHAHSEKKKKQEKEFTA